MKKWWKDRKTRAIVAKKISDTIRKKNGTYKEPIPFVDNGWGTDPNKCWIIQNSTPNEKGFTRLSFYGRKEYAHRLSYTVYKGDIPSGYWVLHTCDIASCINPHHLYLFDPVEKVCYFKSDINSIVPE